MAGIYLLGVLIILIMNYDNIIPSLIDIFRYAFTPHAAFGGFAGSTASQEEFIPMKQATARQQ